LAEAVGTASAETATIITSNSKIDATFFIVFSF